jgi:excisionase family DNA binding protein
MDATTTEHDTLTIAEAADAIRVSRRHLHNLMQNGSGPPVIRLGRHKIIRREALRRWLVERESADATAA